MLHDINIIIGPPGTGKTERLLTLMEQALAQGLRPDEIGFLAFTKKAATEAKDRAMIKFNLTERNLTYVRTIHSLAFRQLALSKTQVMQRSNYIELGERLGIDIKGYTDMDEGTASYGMATGDRLIFIDGLARAKMITLKEQWESGVNEDIDWWELDRVSRGLKAYKEATGLVDFTDMLELFYTQGHLPKLKVLFIDEAQDLSRLQWLALDKIIKATEKVYIAGDDDQAIFAWSGGDTEHFISLPGKVQVLDSSYRVPRSVQLAANEIVNQIGRRRPKVWAPRKDDGAIQWHGDLDTVPLETGEWLLLARNGYMLKQLEDYCMTAGFSFDSIRYSPLRSPALTAILLWERLRKGELLTPEQVKKVIGYMQPQSRPQVRKLDSYHELGMYTLQNELGLKTTAIWHEALDKISQYEREYFIAARRRGETLVKKPRIRISTIHGAKGGEAENVLLLTDLAPRTYNEMHTDLDSELRVMYVAVTRAKQNLHLMQPETNMFFPM